MPSRSHRPKFPPEPAPPIVIVTGGRAGKTVLDNIAIPENLIFRCRNLSVWRDGPFLTFVIPTHHSRANLAKDEARELLAALGVNMPHKTPTKKKVTT